MKKQLSFIKNGLAAGVILLCAGTALADYPAADEMNGIYHFKAETFNLQNQAYNSYLSAEFDFEWKKAWYVQLIDFLTDNLKINGNYDQSTGELVLNDTYVTINGKDLGIEIEGIGWQGISGNDDESNLLHIKVDENNKITFPDFNLILFSGAVKNSTVAEYRNIKVTTGDEVEDQIPENPFIGNNSFKGTMTRYTYDENNQPLKLTKENYTVDVTVSDAIYQSWDRTYVWRFTKFDKWNYEEGSETNSGDNTGNMIDGKFSVPVGMTNGDFFEVTIDTDSKTATTNINWFGHPSFYNYGPTFESDKWSLLDGAVVLSKEGENISLDPYYSYSTYEVSKPTADNPDNTVKYYALNHKWEPTEYVEMNVEVSGEGNKDNGSVVLTISATNIVDPTYEIVITDEANGINETVNPATITDGKYTYQIQGYDPAKDYNLTCTVKAYELGFEAATGTATVELARTMQSALEISNAKADVEENTVTITFDVTLTDIDTDEVTFKVELTDTNNQEADPILVENVQYNDGKVTFSKEGLDAGDYSYNIVLIAYDTDSEEVIARSESATITFSIEADDDDGNGDNGGEDNGDDNGDDNGNNNGGGEGDGWTGIDGVNADNNARYFTLQGIEVKNPVKGIYIKVEGNEVTRVAIR